MKKKEPILLFFLNIALILIWLILSGGCMNREPEIIFTFLRPSNAEVELDPSTFLFTTEYVYLDNLTVRLIELNRSGEYKLQLADSIKIENNKKDYYFKLKEAYFNDGSRILAKDVVNSFKRLTLYGSPHTDPKSLFRGGHELTSLNQEIEGLRIIDDQTVFLGLTHPVKDLYYFLQLVDYGVLHSTQYSKRKLTFNDWTNITSGAYRLQFNGNKLSFIANHNTLTANKEMPQVIEPIIYTDNEMASSINNGKLHFGYWTFSSYMNHKNEFNSIKNIDIFSNSTDGIVTITLNIKSPKFKKLETRQWVLKKILDNFKVEEKHSGYMKKATQYFLPGAKGYLNENKLMHLLDHINTDKIPSEIKNGFTIITHTVSKNYNLENLDQILTTILGVPVKIEYSIKPENLNSFLQERKFDSFSTPASMSYKVLGEAVNLPYTSQSPLWLDPTNIIHELIKEYQSLDDGHKEFNVIENIISQMITDAECIPLYYYTSPFFYNKEILNIDDINIDETPQYWKMQLKNRNTFGY